MDCAKLHQDIEKLKEQYNFLSSMLKSATESGKGKVAISEQLKTATTAEDQILESYLQNFAEHNSEVNGWHLTDCSEKLDIDGALDMALLSNGDLAMMYGNGVHYASRDEGGNFTPKQVINLPRIDGSYLRSIIPLPNSKVLAVHEKYISVISENGDFTQDMIEPSQNHSLTTAAVVSGDEVLIGGEDGLLFTYDLNSSGFIDMIIDIDNDPTSINGFKDIKGRNADVKTIVTLPDSNVLIGGSSGALYQATKQPDGHWKLGERIKIGQMEEYGIADNINDISILSDGSALIGSYSSKGGISHIVKNQEGDWKVKDYVENISDVRAISHLSDSMMLVNQDYDKEIRIIEKDVNGDWVDGGHIASTAEQKKESYNSFDCLIALPDGSAMVGGLKNLYRITYAQPTLEHLKEHLDEISAKRES